MDGNLSLIQTHERSHDIELALKEKFGPDTHIVVHVEPIKPFQKQEDDK